MSQSLRYGAKIIFSVGCWVCFTLGAQSQDLKDIQNEWVEQLSKSISNPPERGEVPLGQSKDTAAADLTPGVAFNRYLSLLITDVDTVSGGGKVKYPDCGEYRIIFALNSGRTIPPSLSSDGKLHEGDIFNRNLISFEFRIKNPEPRAEHADVPVPVGCLPILKFWYSLSETASGKARGERLKDFFINGKMTGPDGHLIGQLPSKVVDIRNLSFDAGQIRTNQFLNKVLLSRQRLHARDARVHQCGS
jgi:hypothetical protein